MDEIKTYKGKHTGREIDEAIGNAPALKTSVDHLNETMGAYSERADIVLTPIATNYVVDSNGTKVSKSGWAMASFTAEKGNVYLFKPGATDGNVCVFAEEITSVETRAIDYTYTYNEDGTIATAVATYGGKTHSYVYTYDADGKATITEGTTVISELPMTYTTTVGSYSPLVRLNADAELPTDGYCRYMSHFKGNSSIKVVVSYKVGSADLTMKVTRDGVLASISTQLGNLSQKEDETRAKVAALQKLAELSNVYVGITRQNGATSPDAETTYGTKALIHEIGKHFQIATVKNGKIQHRMADGRITKAVNGDNVAIDGSDGDVMPIVRGVHLLKGTTDVDGVETNCIGIGLSPCHWHGISSKSLPDFGVSACDTVNCKLDGDYRSCAHSVYNVNAIGQHGAPQGLFVNSYKTSGGGYASQYISSVSSIQQAQNKNEDNLTNRPYIGWYYEFYEAYLTLLYAETGTLDISRNTSFGYGVTCGETPDANTFVGDQIYANSGFQIILSDGALVFYNAMPSKAATIGGESKGNYYLNASISSEFYSQIQMLEGQRVLDGIVKNGWEDKIGTNDNIFYFGEGGELQFTTSAEVDFATGEGMTECTRYYVARNVPNCEGLSDGVMTAVVNIYTKMLFKDQITFGGIDVSNCTVICKQSLPIYRGLTLPLMGHFRQMSGCHYTAKVDADGKATMEFRCAENVEDIPPLTSFGTDSYTADVNSIAPIERGLTKVYDIPFTGNEAWVSHADYSLSMWAATNRASANLHTKECWYLWNNPNNNAGVGKRLVHASVVGCFAYISHASVRTLYAHFHAGYGYDGFAGAFAVLLGDSNN